MADTLKTSGANSSGANTGGTRPGESQNDTGKTLLVGVLGGLVSAAGYLVYQRLPEDQKERLHGQVRGIVESRINEIRQNFNI